MKRLGRGCQSTTREPESRYLAVTTPNVADKHPGRRRKMSDEEHVGATSASREEIERGTGMEPKKGAQVVQSQSQQRGMRMYRIDAAESE